MLLAQALHLVASRAFASLQNGQVLTSSAGGSVTNVRPIQNTTNPTTMKLMTVLMKAPSADGHLGRRVAAGGFLEHDLQLR